MIDRTHHSTLQAWSRTIEKYRESLSHKDRRKWLSLPDIQTLLEISKTSAYELSKKHHLPLTKVHNRYMISAKDFDDWYAHQTLYHKQNGDPPGRLCDDELCMADVAHRLNVAESTVRWWVQQHKIPTYVKKRKRYIRKSDFEAFCQQRKREDKNGKH